MTSGTQLLHKTKSVNRTQIYSFRGITGATWGYNRMNKTYDIGGKKFVLDEEKAVQAYQEKDGDQWQGYDDLQFITS